MNDDYGKLRALYRAARHAEEPSHADRRAVRAALFAPGALSVTAQSAATGKLIALVPGGAKVLTLGQVLGCAALGLALGSSVATTVAASMRRWTP